MFASRIEGLMEKNEVTAVDLVVVRLVLTDETRRVDVSGIDNSVRIEGMKSLGFFPWPVRVEGEANATIYRLVKLCGAEVSSVFMVS